MPTDVPLPPGRTGPGPVASAPHARRRRLRPGGGWLLASRVVLGVVGALTLMVLALAIGMRLDDHQIDAHRGTATATVLSISVLRTGVEFVDGSGVSIRPPDGVLYPGLLSMGQRFQVEYSTVDPTVVRVAGRTAAVGNLVLVLTLAIGWIVGVGLHWSMRRRSRRAVQGPDGSTPTQPRVSRWPRRPSSPLPPAPPA